jgi:hypothetical protein
MRGEPIPVDPRRKRLFLSTEESGQHAMGNLLTTRIKQLALSPQKVV